MSALIILISETPRTLRHIEALLSERGHLVAALSSEHEANTLLDSVTPDLVVADVRGGEYGDLKFPIRSRVDHPDVPVIVTSDGADDIVEAEARRFGATFLESPLANPEFIPTIDAAIEKRRREQPPVRRWFRAPAPWPVEVHAGAARARIVDVSYGGVRLAFESECDIPATFDISIPPAGVALRAQRVWTALSASGDRYWCGAALVDGADAQWRQFIHSLRDA
jgi:DNA-binding response OmpR family regulator